MFGNLVNQYKIHIFIFFGLAYLILGTGLHGDDNVEIVKMQNLSNFQFFYPSPYIHEHYILGLPAHYLLFWAYKFLGYENLIIYDFVKVFVHGITIFFVFKFLTNFFETDRALLGSILFILFPLHDATTYWYMALVYIIPAALMSYSCHHLLNNSWLKSFLFGLLGASFFYTSPPFVFGLGMIFVLQKNYKKFLFFISPGILYVCYYFSIKIFFPFAEKRISDSIDFVSFLKNFIVQILSSVESYLGPSFFLKIFYAAGSIKFISIIILGVIFTFLLKTKRTLSTVSTHPKPLILSLFYVVFFSFVIFSITGYYNHSPFNLGNRTLIFTSFVVSILLISFLPSKKESLIFLSVFFLLPVFGLSDYWKDWNRDQKLIIASIDQSTVLADLPPESLVFIADNLYHKLGIFDHVEFFSMEWNVRTIFKKYSSKGAQFVGLTSYLVIKDNEVIDKKFSEKYILKKNIFLYETKTDKLIKISSLELSNLISNKKPAFRHWIQSLKGTRIEELIIILNPRMDYIFK